MQEKYELYFILSPELAIDAVNTHVETISQLITKELQAENISVDLHGVKKLAYPIKKYKTGYYVLLQFECATRPSTIASVEKKLNINEDLLRYILVNQTDFYKAKAREQKNTNPEFTHHRELNKGKKSKKCIVNYLGIEAIDYKDYTFLNQFTSPYAKLFDRERTGVSSKHQRKIKRAIKRARHMALMPFTPKHFD